MAGPGAADCELLFVYGTLRRGMKLHHHLTHLAARFRMEATVAGELFDLGRYPGARPAKGNAQWVRGELFQLRRPEHDLVILDEVEGFNPREPERSEFVRALADVITHNGERCRAWIYWLGPTARAIRRIGSGDYAPTKVDRALT